MKNNIVRIAATLLVSPILAVVASLASIKIPALLGGILSGLYFAQWINFPIANVIGIAVVGVWSIFTAIYTFMYSMIFFQAMSGSIDPASAASMILNNGKNQEDND